MAAQTVPKPPRARRRQRLNLVPNGLTLAVALAASANARGDSGLLVNGSMTEEFQADTNPLLRTYDKQTLFGSVTSPELTIDDKTSAITLTNDTRVDVGEFNLKGYSSTDVHDNTALTFLHERFSFGSTLAVDYDTTRTSELAASGVNIAGIRHTQINLGPQVTWAFTPALVGQLNGGYLHAHYASNLYTNYQVFLIEPALVWNYSALDTFTLLVDFNRFETLARGFRISYQTIGPSGTWQRQFTERLKGSVNVGIRSLKTSTPVGPSQTFLDTFYNGSLTYLLGPDQNSVGLMGPTQSSIGLMASRALQPTSIGEEITQTRWGANVSLPLTQSLILTSALSYQTNTGDIRLPVFTQKSYLSGNVTLAYQLTSTLSLNSSLRYREQEFIGSNLMPSSQALLIDLIYKPLERPLGL